MIHYVGTPCGGPRMDVGRFLRGRHALIPWVRDEDLGTAASVCESFMFDNGAFTAWNSGEPITEWSGYYEWVEHWRRHPGFDFAVIPDVIDGTEADNNALIIEWLRVLPASVGAPVWHMHESLERLTLLTEQFPRVCIGSSGRWPTPGLPGWWSRMGEAMQAACDSEGRPRTKLHGLRMLDPEVFRWLPLASADSTNAVRNSSMFARFGQYTPPHPSSRMNTIAERAEDHQSAAVWVSVPDDQFRLTFSE